MGIYDHETAGSSREGCSETLNFISQEYPSTAEIEEEFVFTGRDLARLVGVKHKDVKGLKRSENVINHYAKSRGIPRTEGRGSKGFALTEAIQLLSIYIDNWVKRCRPDLYDQVSSPHTRRMLTERLIEAKRSFDYTIRRSRIIKDHNIEVSPHTQRDAWWNNDMGIKIKKSTACQHFPFIHRYLVDVADYVAWVENQKGAEK